MAVPVQGGQPTVWETSGRSELLKGDARGVSISDTGVLMLSPKLTEIFNTLQTYVWSSAVDTQGNVFLGTGHDGKLFRVGADGKGMLLFDFAELDVTALAIARDGAVFAGTSPDGKVYRIPRMENQTCISIPLISTSGLSPLLRWALIVGTGDNGKIYKVNAAGAKPESSLLVSTNQTCDFTGVQPERHRRNDSGGLVLRISSRQNIALLILSFMRFMRWRRRLMARFCTALGDAAATTRSTTPAATAPSDGTNSSTSVTITAIDEQCAAPESAGGNSRRSDVSTHGAQCFCILLDGATDVVWVQLPLLCFRCACTEPAIL